MPYGKPYKGRRSVHEGCRIVLYIQLLALGRHLPWVAAAISNAVLDATGPGPRTHVVVASNEKSGVEFNEDKIRSLSFCPPLEQPRTERIIDDLPTVSGYGAVPHSRPCRLSVGCARSSPAARALDEIDIDFQADEVHALRRKRRRKIDADQHPCRRLVSNGHIAGASGGEGTNDSRSSGFQRAADFQKRSSTISTAEPATR